MPKIRDEWEVLKENFDNPPINKNNFVCAWEGKYIIHNSEIIDYASFFLECPDYDQGVLDRNEEEFYEINWDSNPKDYNVASSVLTAFLVSRFVYYMREIVRSGLKKDYVGREENLVTKIKGRIVHGNNIRKNIIPGHLERFYCAFQEYTVDIPVNRVLKATLLLCQDLINEQSKESVVFKNNETICSGISCSLSYMQNVGQELHPARTCNRILVPHGKLFHNYEEAMKLAKTLLRLEDSYFVSKQSSKGQAKMPDFWIYLPTLFEHYVYGKMKAGGVVLSGLSVQKKGSYNQRADFILNKPDAVIDAKYKDWYGHDKWEEKDSFKDDFREMSGYARDEGYFPNNNAVIPCIIVYPVIEEQDKVECKNDLPEEINQIFTNERFYGIESIPSLKGFYKIGVKIPLLTASQPDQK